MLAEDANAVTIAADVYSFGVIMWEVFALQLPWKKGDRPGCTLSGIEIWVQMTSFGKRLEPTPGMHEQQPALCDLMRRCTAHEPSERPDMAVVVEELQARWEPLEAVMKAKAKAAKVAPR